jgi:signal transduction histidine kinase
MLDAPAPILLLYYVLPLAAVVTSLVLTTWVLVAHRDATAATWVVAMLLSGGLLNLFYLVLTLSGSRLVQRTMIFPRNLALVGFTAGFVLYCSVYTGRNFHRRRPVAAAMAAVFGGFFLLSATGPFHDLLFVGYVPRSEPFGYVVAEPNALYVLFVVGFVAFSGYASYVLADHLLATERRTGWQIVTFLLGALTFMGFEVAGQLGVFPADGLSHASYGVLPIFVLLGLAMVEFDLLDVQPVARTAVVEHLRDPVLVLDADRRVVDFNEASTRVWPDIDEHVSESFETVCPALAREIEVPPESDTARDKIALTADDEDRFFSVTVSAVSRQDGARAGLYSVLLRDVTELEQSLRQLQTQNDRLDQVASTISHDLRNPINVAQGHTSILGEVLAEQPLDPETDQRTTDSLASVRQSHDRMLDIIDDVLTIAQEGKTVQQTDLIDPSAVAREAWTNVDTGAATLAVGENCELTADRSKLLSILENLFRNAVDHGPADVQVAVDATEDGFAVQDDGPGIPGDHHDSIFEYGYTTEGENTGLGLSIVRTMAESHGWTVELDDSYEAGTRFVFSTGRTPGLSESQKTLAFPDDD